MSSFSIDYSNPPQNIVEEAKQLFSGLISWHTRSLEEVARNTDPDAWLPKLYFGLWVFVGICVLVCTGFGVGYHYLVFRSVSGSSVLALAASTVFLVLIELGTVFFGLALFHAIFLKAWWRSWSRVWLVLGVGVLVTVATMWSIRISTRGISSLNKQLKDTQALRSSTALPLPDGVAEIDRQIKELETAKEAGSRSTWRGRTTHEGLAVISANTKLHERLLEQRSLLVSRAAAQQDSLTHLRLAESSTTSTLLTDYGGKAEYGKLLGLFLIAVVAHIIRTKVREEQAANGTGALPKKA